MKTTEFGEPGTVSGTYRFDEHLGRWILFIDCVDWMLVNDSFIFDSKQQMVEFVNKKYNVNFNF